MRLSFYFFLSRTHLIEFSLCVLSLFLDDIKKKMFYNIDVEQFIQFKTMS